jgi:tetratricopeptide (TPR) repeat protein
MGRKPLSQESLNGGSVVFDALIVPSQNKERAMRRDFSPMAAGLLAAVPLMFSTALAGEPFTGLDARESTPGLALVVFQDTPSGAQIMQGKYQDGLDQAAAALAMRPYRDTLVLNTNICAAQLRLGRLEAANESCEAALASRPPTGLVLKPRQVRAAVHVNHGVVHLAQGDYEFAESEFRRAKAMYPGLRIAASNLQFMERSLRKGWVEIVGALYLESSAEGR